MYTNAGTNLFILFWLLFFVCSFCLSQSFTSMDADFDALEQVLNRVLHETEVQLDRLHALDVELSMANDLLLDANAQLINKEELVQLLSRQLFELDELFKEQKAAWSAKSTGLKLWKWLAVGGIPMAFILGVIAHSFF